MAGPSIRAWEFAKALSKDHNVTLIIPNQTDIESNQFKIVCKTDQNLLYYQKQADVLILQTITLGQALFAKRHGIHIILDAYDPLPLETLEIHKNNPEKEKNEAYDSCLSNLLFNFKMADTIICASEKQRDLWLGLLLGQKCITPALYDKDTSLRDYIDVVPFGLPNELAKKTGVGFRQQFGIKQTDKVLIWGGGIWNWFDPLSLIKAIECISHTRDDIKLVFMGIKNPDPSVAEMAMCTQAIHLAKELNILDKYVFFNYGWVPYEERQNFLLEADIGVSTYFDHLETRFSFRTRLLDYIWAHLPIIATAKDSFADIIQQNNLGIVVPPKNVEALVEAILSLVNDPDRMQRIKKQLSNFQSQFQWNTIVEPIQNMISKAMLKEKKKYSYNDIKNCSSFFFAKVREKGIKACFKKLFSKG